jgi:hypothetical protein
MSACLFLDYLTTLYASWSCLNCSLYQILLGTWGERDIRCTDGRNVLLTAGKAEWKKQLVRPSQRWDLEMEFKEIELENMESIHRAQDNDKPLVLVDS